VQAYALVGKVGWRQAGDPSAGKPDAAEKAAAYVHASNARLLLTAGAAAFRGPPHAAATGRPPPSA